MREEHRENIVVIGAGNVGEAIAYTLMVREQASEIVLVDVNDARAKGAAIDLQDGTGFYKQIAVSRGDYSACKNADIVIITAGIARRPGQTRLELAKTNIAIIRDITENIMKYADNPLILVVSNPADILTREVQLVSGLPKERVIGSGTSLDTARFRSNISKKLGVNVTDVQAYILGEHGDSQVPIWSSATIAGLPISEYEQQKGITLDREEISTHTKNGGAQVIDLKGATFYGVAMAVSTIVEAIIHNEHAILPVSHVLGKKYGSWAGVALSLPCRIGGEGIEQSFRVPIDSSEKAALDRSADILRDFYDKAKAC